MNKPDDLNPNSPDVPAVQKDDAEWRKHSPTSNTR